MNYLPYLSIIGACLIFGTSGLWIKSLGLPSPTIAWFRMMVPVILVVFYMLWTRQSIVQTNMKGLLAVSSLNMIRMYLYFVGFGMMSVSHANIILYTNPIFAIGFAWAILGEKINLAKWTSIIIASAGILLIASQKSLIGPAGQRLGIGAIVLSACVQGYTNVMYKQQLKTMNIGSTIFYQCIVGAGFFGLISIIAYPLPSIYQMIIASIYAGLIGICGFGLFFWGMRHIQASDASILTYFEMVFGVIFAWSIQGESLTWVTIMGAILIIISGVIIWIYRSPSSK